MDKYYETENVNKVYDVLLNTSLRVEGDKRFKTSVSKKDDLDDLLSAFHSIALENGRLVWKDVPVAQFVVDCVPNRTFRIEIPKPMVLDGWTILNPDEPLKRGLSYFFNPGGGTWSYIDAADTITQCQMGWYCMRDVDIVVGDEYRLVNRDEAVVSSDEVYNVVAGVWMPAVLDDRTSSQKYKIMYRRKIEIESTWIPHVPDDPKQAMIFFKSCEQILRNPLNKPPCERVECTNCPGYYNVQVMQQNRCGSNGFVYNKNYKKQTRVTRQSAQLYIDAYIKKYAHAPMETKNTYVFLEPGDTIKNGDEILISGEWEYSMCVGEIVTNGIFRRKVGLPYVVR